MSLLIPAPPGRLATQNFSGRPATTWGTQLTSGGSANAEGTVVELIASTPIEIDLLEVTAYGLSQATTVCDGLVSIMTGASFGHTLIPNIMVSFCPAAITTGVITYQFPVRIPAGTRLGAKLRATLTSDTVRVMVRGYKTGAWAGSYVEALGAVTASSRGTLLTPGTSSEGTLTSIGTTVFAYKAVLLGFAGNNDTTLTTVSLNTGDIGLSGAAIGGLSDNGLIYSNTSEAVWTLLPFVARQVNIASGTALYARLQGHSSSTDQNSVIIYGIG